MALTKRILSKIKKKFKVDVENPNDFKIYHEEDQVIFLDFLLNIKNYSYDEGYFYTDKEFYRIVDFSNLYSWSGWFSTSNIDVNLFKSKSKNIELTWKSSILQNLFFILHNYNEDFYGLYNSDYDGFIDDNICFLSFNHSGKMSEQQCLDFSISIMYKAASEHDLILKPLNLYKHLLDEETEEEPGFIIRGIPKYDSNMTYYLSAVSSNNEIYKFISFYKILENMASAYHDESLIKDLEQKYSYKRLSSKKKLQIRERIKEFISITKSDERALSSFAASDSINSSRCLKMFAVIKKKDPGSNVKNYIVSVFEKLYRTRNSLVHSKKNFNSKKEYFSEAELSNVNKVMHELTGYLLTK